MGYSAESIKLKYVSIKVLEETNPTTSKFANSRYDPFP